MAVQEEFLRFAEAELQPEHEGFAVTNDGAADWCVRKIGEAERRKAERAAFVQAEIDRLKAFQTAGDAQDDATIANMTRLLAPYFETLRPTLGKRKSHKLPHGVLQVRASAPKWARQDNAALLEWAKPLGLVRVKEEPAWADIAKRLRHAEGAHMGDPAIDGETGEIVAGVVLEAPAGESFTVRVDEGGEA